MRISLPSPSPLRVNIAIHFHVPIVQKVGEVVSEVIAIEVAPDNRTVG
jgi:hypothetical protein